MNLDTLLSTGDNADIVMEVFDTLIEQTAQGDTIDVLKPAARTFYLTQNFDTYMNNDGFAEFFITTPPDHIRDTLRALEDIGAKKMNVILQNAIAIWPVEIPKSRAEREAMLLNNEDLWANVFEKLNNEYLTYPDEMDVLQVVYIEKFKTDFIEA